MDNLSFSDNMSNEDDELQTQISNQNVHIDNLKAELRYLKNE